MNVVVVVVAVYIVFCVERIKSQKKKAQKPAVVVYVKWATGCCSN